MPVFKEGKRASSPTKLLTDSLTYMFSAPWHRPPPSCEHNPQPSVTESMGLEKTAPSALALQGSAAPGHCFGGVQALWNPLSPGLLGAPIFRKPHISAPCLIPTMSSLMTLIGIKSEREAIFFMMNLQDLTIQSSVFLTLADPAPGQAVHLQRRNRRKNGKFCSFLPGQCWTLKSNHHQSI